MAKILKMNPNQTNEFPLRDIVWHYHTNPLIAFGGQLDQKHGCQGQISDFWTCLPKYAKWKKMPEFQLFFEKKWKI